MGNKTEVVTLRLEPRLRYGLELLARKQRRTLSAVLEWLIQLSIDDDIALSKLWSVDKLERIHNLAKYSPELLTYEEQVILKEQENDG